MLGFEIKQGLPDGAQMPIGLDPKLPALDFRPSREPTAGRGRLIKPKRMRKDVMEGRFDFRHQARNMPPSEGWVKIRQDGFARLFAVPDIGVMRVTMGNNAATIRQRSWSQALLGSLEQFADRSGIRSAIDNEPAGGEVPPVENQATWKAEWLPNIEIGKAAARKLFRCRIDQTLMEQSMNGFVCRLARRDRM